VGDFFSILCNGQGDLIPILLSYSLPHSYNRSVAGEELQHFLVFLLLLMEIFFTALAYWLPDQTAAFVPKSLNSYN